MRRRWRRRRARPDHAPQAKEVTLPAWTIRCTYGEDALAKRDAALAAHEAYLVAHSRQIDFAGPMFADDGETRTGLWLMIEAPDRAGAEAFIGEEGFNRAGMFGAIEIKRFAAAGRPMRRQVETTADPLCQMFICECRGGLAADDGFASLAERALVRGRTMTDDGSRALGSLAIVEAVDRGTLDALVATAPDPAVRVDRWRFGKSVV